jgi:hypothetical protein
LFCYDLVGSGPALRDAVYDWAGLAILSLSTRRCEAGRSAGVSPVGRTRPKSVIERPNRPIPEADVQRRMAPAAARRSLPFGQAEPFLQSSRSWVQRQMAGKGGKLAYVWRS